MPSPFDTARRRAYVLALLRQQKRDGDPWTFESLIVQTVKRHGLSSSASVIHEDLDYLKEEGLAKSRKTIEEVTGIAQTFWSITSDGICVAEGTTEPPAGLRGE